MKKLCRTLSLTTALSTASLMTFMPLTNVQASPAVEDPTAVEQRIGLHTATNLTPQDTVHKIHFQILADLEKYWNLQKVSFSYEAMSYEYYDEELLIKAPKGFAVTDTIRSVGEAVTISMKGWRGWRQDFLKAYFDYRRVAINLSLLKVVNTRHAQAPITVLRYTSLDDTLDAHYLLEMSELIEHIKHEAQTIPLPITKDFETKGNVDLLKLAAATLELNEYTPEILADVKGHMLDQIAFRAVFSKLLYDNTTMENFREGRFDIGEALPVCKDASYQKLLDAEAFLAMVMSQKYIVHPEDVLALFTKNQEALTAEQEKYAHSGLIKSRNRPLLATPLAREAVHKQTRIDTGIDLTEEEADRYIATNDSVEKATVITDAKKRLDEEASKDKTVEKDTA